MVHNTLYRDILYYHFDLYNYQFVYYIKVLKRVGVKKDVDIKWWVALIRVLSDMNSCPHVDHTLQNGLVFCWQMTF